MDIQKIREQHQLDVILLFGADEILAATEVYAPKSCLIVDEQGMTLVCPEGQEGKEGLPQLEYVEFGFARVEHAVKNMWQLIKTGIEGRSRIGYNKFNCPLALTAYHGPVYIDISETIAEGMICKSQSFFEKYAAVKELNVLAYDRIRREIHAGCTEQELYGLVKETYVANREGQVLYTGDFLSGRRTCEIAGLATGKKIAPGDTVIVDALCAYEGVYCDTTRSYFCGEPTKEQIRAYEILCALHDEVKPLLRPGTIAGDIYNYVNRRLKEEGYGGLVHHAGHGLGYRWYEAPYFIADCYMELKEDMLVAIEPGVYLPEQYGLRLENNYRVTEKGGVDVLGYKQSIEDFILN